MMLTPWQMRTLTLMRGIIIIALTFIAGYEWAHLCDLLDRGGMIYD